MTEERAIYEIKEELKYARWLIGEQAEKIKELESDNIALKYKLRKASWERENDTRNTQTDS